MGEPKGPQPARPVIAPHQVALGYVSGVFGLQGEVRLFLYNPDSQLLSTELELDVHLPGGGCRRARVSARQGAGKRVLGRISGVEDPEAASAMQGAVLVIDKDRLPVLGEDEYYHHQLIGLPVRTEGGQTLGRIAEIHGGSAFDIWVVRGPGGEHWIPFKMELVRELVLGSHVLVADDAPMRMV